MRTPAQRRLLRATAGVLGLCALLWLLDFVFPPPLQRVQDTGYLLLDRHGEPLRYGLASDGRLRLSTRPEDVDAKLLTLLVAYEDKRFWMHPGVDPLAVARAIAQAIANGHVVSGASTLTMQTARLLTPHARTPANKLIEALRAVQLELHFSKREILALYLTLAPYGGNIEGVSAATHVWFGKGPAHLTPGEAALLVALPQSPTRLRPDRHPEAARAARAKVLDRVGDYLRNSAGEYWDAQALQLARTEAIVRHSSVLPFLAPHLADRLAQAHAAQHAGQASGQLHRGALSSCLDADLQRRVESIARSALPALNRSASVAILVVDNASAEARAYVGNADYLASSRAGQVDVIRAVRSPGSTLKPFIYGLAFDLDLARPATLTLDAPTRFGSYSPVNFEGQYYGTLTLIEALRRSLNVPAVTLLDAIGPVRFAGAFAEQGTPLQLPAGTSRPGLAVALGGAGITLEQLLRQYRGLANDGQARPIRLQCAAPTSAQTALPDVEVRDDNHGPTMQPMLSAATRWHIRRILQNVAAPATRAEASTLGHINRIAQKTGTSYGFRDAWAFGYDARYTVGVWVGRADGTPHPGHYGYNTASPILFQVFDELPHVNAPPGGTEAPAPVDAQLAWQAESLPARLRFIGRGEQRQRGPRMLFPMPDATLLAGTKPVQFTAEGGAPPYTWLVNGLPIATTTQGRVQWQPDASGFAVATVIDASGDYDRVPFRVASFDESMTGQHDAPLSDSMGELMGALTGTIGHLRREP